MTRPERDDLTKAPVILWFRRDLRLRDNMALHRAIMSGHPILPLFIIDPRFKSSPHFSHNRMAFLMSALDGLDRTLSQFGSQLRVRVGLPQVLLPQIARETGAAAVFHNRDYTPFAAQRDKLVRQRLEIPVHVCHDHVLIEPGSILKADGSPFQVFTPFFRRWQKLAKPGVVACDLHAANFVPADQLSQSTDLRREATQLRPEAPIPPAAEADALLRLERFVRGPITHYEFTRNDLLIDPFGDSADPPSACLSHYLHLGILSPRTAYWSARRRYENCRQEPERQSIEAWIRQLAWRDFFICIMHHFPRVRHCSFRAEYDNMRWRRAPDELQAWRDGRTGFPLIDAAMRQLRAIGWMPNRARMVVASFLAKDLLIDWSEGEAHFMRHLLDGDQAANNGGWQWAAGTGTDAQPYFRVFNPVLQSKRYDATGQYLRHWIPELRGIPDRFIHEPWRMPAPPADYPTRIVDHQLARARAIDAYQKAKDSANGAAES